MLKKITQNRFIFYWLAYSILLAGCMIPIMDDNIYLSLPAPVLMFIQITLSILQYIDWGLLAITIFGGLYLLIAKFARLKVFYKPILLRIIKIYAVKLLTDIAIGFILNRVLKTEVLSLVYSQAA